MHPYKITFKFLTAAFFLVFALNIQAQNTKPTEGEEYEQGWNKSGKISAIFNQSAFSNWIAGGEDNFALNLSVNYKLTYVKDEFKWDNTIITDFGFTRTKNSEFTKKTNDRILLNTLAGLKLNKRWYFSTFVNFRSQFAKGYLFTKDDNGKEIRTQNTEFLSPGFLSFGPGILWAKKKRYKINIAPATARFIFVNKDFTLPEMKYFGVNEGEAYNVEFGLSVEAYAKFDLIENVNLEHILFLYSDYLANPENVDIDYTLNVTMKINEYLSTNIAFQTIYDNNAYRGFQINELFGFGVNYTL